MTTPPEMLVSGLRKCCSAARALMQEASVRLPSWLRMWMSALMDQHFDPAIRQRDSVSRAPERRRVFSRRRESRTSVSEGREGSKEGEAIGESSVVIVKMPSKGRSGKGVVTSAVMWVWTRVFPSLTSQTPYSSPNSSSRLRNWSNARPSIRRFSWSAFWKNWLSLSDGPTSRGIFAYIECISSGESSR